jgi:hypothetical protein
MPLLRSRQPSNILQTPFWRSLAIVIFAGTTWGGCAYAQQGAVGGGATGTTGGAGGANVGTGAAGAPSTPSANNSGPTEEPRPALPQSGGIQKPSDGGTQTGSASNGSGTIAPQKPSPFALPEPSTADERDKKSPFTRQNTGASSLFGTQLNPIAPDGTLQEQSSTSTTEGPRVIDAPTTFSAPGFYGGGGVALTTGRGRLAKPRQKWSLSASMGFDDNSLQTPTDGGGTEDQVIRQVIPAVPELSTTVTRTVRTGQFRILHSSTVPVFRTETEKVVIRPAQPEQVLVENFDGIPDRERESSVTSSLDLSYTSQWAKGRSAFTMDARAGVDYYWSRSQDPLEYEGSLSLLYIRKMSPRLQISTALSASHQTQPDFSRLNSLNAADVNGAYTIGTSKTDLSYRWNRRVSTVTSLTADIREQSGQTTGTGSFMSFGLGQEVRYIWSPRLTLSGEARYAKVDYLEGENSNSTITLLTGVDWDITRHLRATVRLGESIRSFEPQGDDSTSPFGELSLNYQPSRKDTFTLSSRYGFEESSTPGAEQLVFRTSLSYQRLFTPKLVGSASINSVSYETISEGGSSTQKVLDGSLGLRYFYTRKLKFGANYSYTNSKTDLGISDYYRNRIFFTGEYEF